MSNIKLQKCPDQYLELILKNGSLNVSIVKKPPYLYTQKENMYLLSVFNGNKFLYNKKINE
jgi:hypothetical protein